MRLIRLYANKTSFHTVEFKDGVNFIAGSATQENKGDTQKTYNSVGKSLLIKLIDFCLGCEAIPAFSDNIPDWIFTLEFEVNGEKYIASRSVERQQRITLNGEEMSVDTFKNYFLPRVFLLPRDIKYLTWRSLISRFIRPRKESYVYFDTISQSETPYQKLINTTFLLGLDIDFVQKKKELKAELDRVIELQDNLENDDIFKKFFTKDKDADIELADLEDEIKELQAIVDSFEVADSYYDIQKEADQLAYEAQQIKNQITLLENSVKQINKTLEVKVDVTPETIIELYSEAKKNLSDGVVKTLEQVNAFHLSLLRERNERLTLEREEILGQIKTLQESRQTLGDKLNESLKFLGSHKALDELVAINSKLADLRANLERLKNYKGVIQEYQNKTEEINISLSEENIKTNNYITEAYPIIERNINTFRLMSKEFYDDKAGGIEIKQNKGVNQCRFDISVRIDDDTSDGVNEVKMFCFDMTLLLTKHTHSVRFLVHDSRLYSNIDPRQRATLFRQASKYSNLEGFQYIATVNEDQIESVREFYSEEEYKNIIEDNIILHLTDESEASKLLGIQVNLDYEK